MQKCRQHEKCFLGAPKHFCTGQLKSTPKSRGNTNAPRLLYEDRIADLSKRLKDERRRHRNHHMT